MEGVDAAGWTPAVLLDVLHLGVDQQAPGDPVAAGPGEARHHCSGGRRLVHHASIPRRGGLAGGAGAGARALGATVGAGVAGGASRPEKVPASRALRQVV